MLCYHCMHEKGGAAECPYCHRRDYPTALPHQMRPGTILAQKYTIGRVLGEGGFGITYIGLNNSLQITVAVKEYYPSGYSNRNTAVNNYVSVITSDKNGFYEKGRLRFLNEARTLAKFQEDPGIVNVVDFIEENHTAYIVMEYLDGITLREHLKKCGRINPNEAVQMLLPVMRALDKVHDAGIIHRDVSPDNIMMLKDGSLKLMDFGAARDFGGDERSMSVMLKQGYAPEEQYRRNGEQGAWTDVYGMCATLYRLITGSTPPDSIERVYRDTIRRPSEMGINISPTIENALMNGLAVHKENRCPDMKTLIANLTGQGGDHTMLTPPIVGGSGFTKRDENQKDNTVIVDDGDSDGQMPMPPYPAPPRPIPEQEPPQQTKSGSKALIIIAICLAILVLIGGVITIVVLSKQRPEPEKDDNTESSSATEIQPTEAPTEEETQPIEMPDLVGMNPDDAIDKMADMNMSISKTIYIETNSQAPGKVCNQVPKAGSELKDNAEITLYIAKEKATNPPTQASTKKPDPKPDTSQVTPPSVTSNTLYCIADTYVSLHSSASTSSSDIRKVWKGQMVQYISRTGRWYYINAGGTYGYADSEYLSFNRNDISTKVGILYANKNVDYLAVRAEPNEKATVLARIPPSGSMVFKGSARDNGGVKDGYHVQWAYVEYNGVYGYVYDYYLHD